MPKQHKHDCAKFDKEIAALETEVERVIYHHQKAMLGTPSFDPYMTTWALAHVLRRKLDLMPADVRAGLEADLVMICVKPYEHEKVVPS